MKTNEFKSFLSIIENAGHKNPIWFCGFAFMKLTKKQHDELWDKLNELGYPHEIVTNQLGTFDGIKIPSGIVLLKG